MNQTQLCKHPSVMPRGSETYSSAMAEANNYMAWLIEAFAHKIEDPVLEIGVGHGSYAQHLQGHGRYLGVDIDPNEIGMARKAYPNLRFEVADITKHEFIEQIAGEEVRSVVCLNVLEHITDDQTAVSNLARVLASGGQLYIVVPAMRMLTNDLDRLAGHLRRYRREEVARLISSAGLVVKRADYFNPLGGIGWWANRLVRHRSLNDTAVNGQIALFDRYAVPLSRILDPLTRKFFGQSIIAIGRKI